jgi:RsiW-degrading membrane proteinase PrsW (M82 family)
VLTTRQGLTAFSILFAFVWGMVFKHYIVRTDLTWTILTSALFFTGVVGIPLLLMLYAFAVRRFFLSMPHSTNAVVSLLGCVVRVGVFEEHCKIIPVAAYLLWKRANANPKHCILVGVFCGLGFAAFENMDYYLRAIDSALRRTEQFGKFGRGEMNLRDGVRGAMANVLARSMSLVFCYALFTGIFA